MNLTVPRTHLVRLLQLVQSASGPDGGAALPLFSYVRIDAMNGMLETAAMSIDVAARASAPAVIAEPGVVVVPLRRCLDAARTLSGETISVKVHDGRLVLTGDDGTARLPTLAGGADQLLDPWGIKVAETAATVFVDATAFRQGLLAVRHAAAPSDDGRHALRGILLQAAPAGTRLVATDGGRMGMAEVGGVADQVAECILPPPAVDSLVAALEGLAGAIQLDLDANVCKLEARGLAVRATGVAAKFPDYRGALAMFTRGAQVAIASEALAGALRRCIAVAGPKIPVRVTFDGQGVTLDAESIEGRADAQLTANRIGGEQPAMTVGVNPRFLLDAVSAYGEHSLALGALVAGGTPCALDLRYAGEPERLRCVVVMVAVS